MCGTRFIDPSVDPSVVCNMRVFYMQAAIAANGLPIKKELQNVAVKAYLTIPLDGLTRYFSPVLRLP